MNTRVVMIASAVAMFIAGAVATFLPQEILLYLGAPVEGALPLIVSLVGALYLSFAMLNWTAKDSLIGGIYNRPVSIGNLLHFTMGALALGKAAIAGPFEIVCAAIVYAFFVIAFAMIFFTSPVRGTAQRR